MQMRVKIFEKKKQLKKSSKLLSSELGIYIYLYTITHSLGLVSMEAESKHCTMYVLYSSIFTAFILEAFILEYTLQTVPRLESVVEAKIKELGLGIGQ